MKRMIAFIFFVVFAVLCSGETASFTKADFSLAERAVMVSSTPIDNKNNFFSGGNFYTYFESEELKELLQKINQIEGVKGFNLYFSSDVKYDYFQSQIDFVGDLKEIDEMIVYQGYSKFYSRFVWLDGKKNNVQLAKTTQGWVLGFPVILTGF